MYFGNEQEDNLDQTSAPVLQTVLVVSALIMVVGIANLFGIEGAAEAAALTLVR